MTKHWWKRAAGLLCLGLLIFAAALPAKAESKNFYFPKVHIDIQIAYEKQLLRFLFDRFGNKGVEPGSQFTLSFMKKYMKTTPAYFQKWYLAWSKKIRKESVKKNFIEPQSLKSRNKFLLVTIGAAVLTVNPIIAVLAAFLVQKIKRRSREWAHENELWKALKRFLDDFSDFKEIPPEAYKLWEHYLIFGILFGNAKKIIKMLPRILCDERAVVPTWYPAVQAASFMASGAVESMIQSIETMSTSIVEASTSAAHYSSGSGGGFSGGGGGGGTAG